MNNIILKDYDYVKYEHPNYKYKLCIEQSYMTNITGLDVDHDYFNLDTNGILSVRHGYCWDGSSGPTWDTDSSMRASLFHDALYQMMREKDLSLDWRYIADKVYHRICLEDGMWRVRAWYQFRAVRSFGEKSARPAN